MEFPTVSVAEGQLRGGVTESYDGHKINSFLGIPFAKAPVGDLRFKPPVPAEPWSGTRDATVEGEKCIQRNLLTNIVEGSEDCLQLNVFTRELPSPNCSLKPVMVWIHGGAYLHGSNTPSLYGPDYLLTEDVVLVTINYRFGLLGFLNVDPSLGVPANLGIKDQALALRWVQRNIASFNGDPANVTIFGESAGAISVMLLLLSASTEGVFHKAIMQSPAVLATSPQKPSLVEIARHAGKEAKGEREALEVLKSLSCEALFHAQEKYLEELKTSYVFFPDVEKSAADAVMTDMPLKVIASGVYNKVPTMIGFNSNEGILFEVERRLHKAHGKEALMKKPDPERFLPKDLTSKVPPEVLQRIHQKIKEVYFSRENLKNPYLFPSDAMFNAGIITAAKLQALTSPSPVYLYLLDIDDEYNLFKKRAKCEDIPGMSHADELGYIFCNTLVPKIPKGSTSEIAMRRLVTLWTNFAKRGNPTPDPAQLGFEWRPVTKEAVNYVEISGEIRVAVDPIPDRYKVWQEIYRVLGALK